MHNLDSTLNNRQLNVEELDYASGGWTTMHLASERAPRFIKNSREDRKIENWTGPT